MNLRYQSEKQELKKKLAENSDNTLWRIHNLQIKSREAAEQKAVIRKTTTENSNGNIQDCEGKGRMLHTRVTVLSTMSRFQPQIMRRAEKQEDTAATKEKTANRKCL